MSLVNQKGHELPIKEAFERYIKKVKLTDSFWRVPLISLQLDMPGVKYEYFDFHAECSKMRWHRISLLIEKLQADLIRNGFVSESDDRGKKRS